MPAKILVADDDPDVRSYLSALLRLEGHDVTTVADGTEALRAASEQRPAVVILDVMMPGSDGVNVLKQLRSQDDTAELPVILLTARVDDESTWAGWRAGCDSYIPKPFDPETLTAAVEQLITR